MELLINGKKETINDEIILDDYIKSKVTNPDNVVIEYNHEIVTRDKWKEILIKDGDSINFKLCGWRIRSVKNEGLF